MPSGHATGLRRIPPEAVADLETRFTADERAQLKGEPPMMQQIVSNDPAVPAAYKAADAVSFYLQPVPAGVWENRLTLRSTRWARMYSPGEFIDRVSPTPLLMLVAAEDTVAPFQYALDAYEQAREPKQIRVIAGGHFDAYTGPGFEECASAAREHFVKHLRA